MFVDGEVGLQPFKCCYLRDVWPNYRVINNIAYACYPCIEIFIQSPNVFLLAQPYQRWTKPNSMLPYTIWPIPKCQLEAILHTHFLKFQK